MDKKQIISLLETQLAAGTITRDDLSALANGEAMPVVSTVSAPSTTSTPTAAVPQKQEGNHSKYVVYALYAIGAVTALAGITILIAQNWEQIGFLGRVLVTAGIAFVSYAIALLLGKHEHRVIAQVLFAISAGLAPLGVYVFLEEMRVDFTLETQMLIAGMLAVIYGAALLVSKRPLLVLVTTAFATWLYWAYVFQILTNAASFEEEMLKWASIVSGVAYICIGYGYRALSTIEDSVDKRAVVGFLYTLGTLAVLGGASMLGGVFDLAFIGLLFVTFYASVFLRSRGMLGLSAIFLIVHLIKLTGLYFVGSLGWPIALIGIGFLVIGVGYGTYYLNRHFIAAK